MKSIFKYLAVAAMAIALTGLTGCKEKPEDTTHSETDESTSYAFQYQGSTPAAGATVDFTPNMQQTANDWAAVDFYMVNKTSADLQSVLKVERKSGPASFDNLSICYGETCKTGTCPYTSDVMTLTPGVNTDLRVTIDYAPSAVTEETVYRITLGKGTALDDPQVLYINLHGATK